MNLKEVIAVLEELCPLNFAVKWDNPGLQVGRMDKEIRAVGLAVDATSEVIRRAVQEKVDLLLTHHPLLFSGVSHVTDSDYLGSRVLALAAGDIACYAMHTNFDVLGMGDAAADLLGLGDRKVLEVTYEDELSVEGIGRVGSLPEPLTLKECAQRVSELFEIPHVRYYGDPEGTIVTCAILPGSGKDDIDLALKEGADVMITGDITHHVGIDAVEKGICIIDAGHYGVEKLFIPYMTEYLKREIPVLRIVSCDAGAPYQET